MGFLAQYLIGGGFGMPYLFLLCAITNKLPFFDADRK